MRKWLFGALLVALPSTVAAFSFSQRRIPPEAPLRIGTGGSPLSLARAFETRRRLKETFPEWKEDGGIEICVVKSQRNRIFLDGSSRMDPTRSDSSNEQFYRSDLHRALLLGEVDMCVHSMKDVPTILPAGTILPSILEREDSHDAIVCKHASSTTSTALTTCSIDSLPDYSVIATRSHRRRAQLLARNPTFRFADSTGKTMHSRLRKVEAGTVDATIVAIAGLNLNADDSSFWLGPSLAKANLPWDEMLPAVGQGAIGIMCRPDDEITERYASAINHADTFACVACERSFFDVMGGGWMAGVPVAGQALMTETKNLMKFRGLILSADGRRKHQIDLEGPATDAEAIGRKAGQQLRVQAGDEFWNMTGWWE